MHELGHCYDLPQCVIHSLSDKSIKDLSLSDLPFVRVAPTKLLAYWLSHRTLSPLSTAAEPALEHDWNVETQSQIINSR
jgi:hypothetical protein